MLQDGRGERGFYFTVRDSGGWRPLQKLTQQCWVKSRIEEPDHQIPWTTLEGRSYIYWFELGCSKHWGQGGEAGARLPELRGQLCEPTSCRVLQDTRCSLPRYPKPAVESGPGRARSPQDQGFSKHNELSKPSSLTASQFWKDSSSSHFLTRTAFAWGTIKPQSRVIQMTTEFKQKTKASVWKHSTWPLHEAPEKPGDLAEKENPKLWETTSEKRACSLPRDKTASNTVIWLTGPSAWGRLSNCLLSHTRIHKQSLLSTKWDPGQKSLSPSSSVTFCTLSQSAFWVASLSSSWVDVCPCLSLQHYKPQEDSQSGFCNSTWWEPSTSVWMLRFLLRRELSGYLEGHAVQGFS